MIIDTVKIKKLICDSGIPTTKLEKGTGVNRVTISNLRSGRSDWSKVWLTTLEKFQKYIDENEGEIKMIKKQQLELNELAELQELAKEGVTVGLPEDIVSIYNDEAEEGKMTTAEFVENFVDDLSGIIELHEDGSIDIKGEGLVVIDNSNLCGNDLLDWLGNNSNFKELFTNSVKAEELVEQIYDTYFD